MRVTQTRVVDTKNAFKAQTPVPEYVQSFKNGKNERKDEENCYCLFHLLFSERQTQRQNGYGKLNCNSQGSNTERMSGKSIHRT